MLRDDSEDKAGAILDNVYETLRILNLNPDVQVVMKTYLPN